MRGAQALRRAWVVASVAAVGVGAGHALVQESAEAAQAPAVYTAWRGIQEFVVLQLSGTREASVEYGVVLRCTGVDRPGTTKRSLVSTISHVRPSGGRLIAQAVGLPAGSTRTTRVDMAGVRDGQMAVRVRIAMSRGDQRCRADTTFLTRRASVPARVQPE